MVADFSHIDFVFVPVNEASVNLGARRPRGHTGWPLVGISRSARKPGPTACSAPAARCKSRPGHVS
ncbi:MAG: hypothetical protein WEC75_10080 [Dehalococcoidia bacterium]